MKLKIFVCLSTIFGIMYPWTRTIINYSASPKTVIDCEIGLPCNSGVWQPGQKITYPIGAYCLNSFGAGAPGAQPAIATPSNGCANQLLSIREDGSLNLQSKVIDFSGGDILFGAGAPRVDVPGNNCQNHIMIINQDHSVVIKSYVFDLNQFSGMGQALLNAGSLLNNLVNPHFANDCVQSGVKQPALLDSAYSMLETAFNLIDKASPMLDNLADANNPNNPLMGLQKTANSISALPVITAQSANFSGANQEILVKLGDAFKIPAQVTQNIQSNLDATVKKIHEKEMALKQVGVNIANTTNNIQNTLQAIKSNAQSLQNKKEKILNGLKTRITNLRTKINNKVPDLICSAWIGDRYSLPQRIWCLGSLITAADPSVITCMPVS